MITLLSEVERPIKFWEKIDESQVKKTTKVRT